MTWWPLSCDCLPENFMDDEASLCPSHVRVHCIYFAHRLTPQASMDCPPPNFASLFTLNDQVSRPPPCLGFIHVAQTAWFQRPCYVLSKNMFSPPQMRPPKASSLATAEFANVSHPYPLTLYAPHVPSPSKSTNSCVGCMQTL